MQLSEVRERMDKAIEAMRREFGSVRTSKATTALLDIVRVEAYGTKMPLNQVATVSAPEPRLLLVQPWDTNLLAQIEKAIRTSDLGLNPSSDGGLIRVPIPALTEERRRDLVKLLHKLAEDGRVAVRQARQEANKEIKREQDQGLSEDEAFRLLEQVQALTDEHVGRVDELLQAKEREVMEV